MSDTQEIQIATSTSLKGMPDKFGDKYKMAQILSQSGMLPAGLNTPEKITVALQWAYELGLSPMVGLNNIAVVSGKPTLSTDIMHAICRRSPEYGGCQWLQQDATKAECIITRQFNGIKEEIRGCYTIEDAKAAGLTGKDNWKKYPARMLKHRALSYALRDAFPDMLAGIYEPEEMEQTPAEKPIRNITPVASATKENPKTVVNRPIENLEGTKFEVAAEAAEIF